MNITIICNAILPAVRYGGTERVVWYLAKELSNQGHRVTLLAAKGSYCDFARILPIVPNQKIERQIPADADIVHFNSLYSGPIEKPHLVTIHGNFLPAGASRNSVFVSQDHARRFGCEAFVHNGLDWDDYGTPDLNLPRQHYHFLGKAAWKVKNLRGAIRLCRLLNERLHVLGGNRLNLKMGMRLTLTPRVRFYGMVDNAGKKLHIERSKGLLFPVKWHEPFGLAIPESLYFGAPVFGTPYGSLPELITPEVGFLTNRADLMEKYLRDSPVYPARLCHDYALELFNSKRMADSYLSLYEKVLCGEPLNASVPNAADTIPMMPWYE